MTLIIEYLTEGKQRGYNFTSPTHGYAEDTLKTVWRNAMPRGQGWGQVTGAESLKCFALKSGHMAVSRVTVTDAQDETGRRGIRRAEIDVMTLPLYVEYLNQRFTGLPKGIQEDARFIVESWQRVRTLERVTRKLNKTDQLIVSHPFTTTADWQVMEGLLIKLALSPIHPLKRTIFSFTTLAMAHHEEGYLVAIPASKIAGIKDVPVIEVG